MISLSDKLASGLARLVPFGNRDANPLASAKAATRWIEGLAVGDAFKFQQAILGELRRFNEAPTPPAKDRVAVLMLLDEKSRDQQDTLVRQYLRNPRMSRAGENQLWHAVYALYWELARGYHDAALRLAGEAGQTRNKAPTPLITLRAIRALGQLLKWRAVRYLPAGNPLWLQLHTLYRAAETLGFHRHGLQAYADEAANCSCEAAYLHVLMLNLANSGTLYPRQLDLIDRWLGNWHGMLHLHSQPAPATHAFCVDLSAGHGARRLRKIEPDKPLRFWATDAVVEELEALHAALHKGLVPAQVGLTEAARPSESLELLEHLQHQWTALNSREQRRAPREPIKRLVDVAHGLNSIVSQLKADDPTAAPETTGFSSSDDDLLVFGFVTERTLERLQTTPSWEPHDVERWAMQDESEYGYGAIVESSDKDWLRVGALVGLRPHDASGWRIGVVRRLSRLGENVCSVGIETLAETPTLAMLHDTAPPSYTVNGLDNGGARQPSAGLWLAGGNRADSVIIDPILFTPGKVFAVHGVAERSFIALGSPIERSEGWERVAAEPVNG